MSYSTHGDVDYPAVESLLGFSFNNKENVLSAITHRSYLNENRTATHAHNERLEFLGDAVLELVITDFLYHKYPEKPEGELTSVRAALVNTVSLAEASTKLGINEYLLMSKGESKEFIATHLFPKTEMIVEKRLWQDPKSRFQELAQEHTNTTPTYKTLGQEGPDHDRVFTVGVCIGKEQIAEGTGRSKQEAEQQAAENGITAKAW